MNTLTLKPLSQKTFKWDTPLSHEILVLFYGAQDFDLQRYQKSNQALDRRLESFDASDYLRSKSPLIINDILAIKFLTQKDEKRKYYSQILALIQSEPRQAINLPILLLPKEEVTEYKDIFEKLLCVLIKDWNRVNLNVIQKVFSYLPDDSKKKVATYFYQCFTRGQTGLWILFRSFHTYFNAIERSNCLDAIAIGLESKSYSQGLLDSTSGLPDTLKKRFGIGTIMNIIRNKTKYTLCLGSLFQVLSEEDKQRVITEIQKTRYTSNDDIQAFIYAVNTFPSDYHTLLEWKIREVIGIACKHTSGYAPDKTHILSLQLIPLLPIKSQVEICNQYAKPIWGTAYYGDIYNYDLCIFLLHASDEVFASQAFDSLRKVMTNYSYEEFLNTASARSLSKVADPEFAQAAEKLFKKLWRWAETDPSRNWSIGINKLSQHINKTRTSTSFSKTGSELTLLSGRFEGNCVMRKMNVYYYLQRRDLFEDFQLRKNHWFDYVPIEPILKVWKPDYNLNVNISTWVLDTNLRDWIGKTSLYADELLKDRDKILDALKELWIDHGHPHDENFCLKFQRNKDGSIDYTTKPRLYLIDFDAVGKAQ